MTQNMSRLVPGFADILHAAANAALGDQYTPRWEQECRVVAASLAAKVPTLCPECGSHDDHRSVLAGCDACPTIADVLAAGVQAMEAGR